MSNVYVNSLGVPRKARNKRIYAGNSFVFTNQSQQSQSVQKHFENGRLSNLSSNLVIVYFTQPFSITYPTRVNLQVYRIVDIGGDRYVYENVLYYHTAPPSGNQYGFGLVIDPSESLTDVVVEYCFTE